MFGTKLFLPLAHLVRACSSPRRYEPSLAIFPLVWSWSTAVFLSCPMRVSLLRLQSISSHSQHATASTFASISSLLSSSSLNQEDTVSVNGWIRSIRSLKHVNFIDLNDGSDHTGLQAVLPAKVLKACDESTRSGLSTGASVRLQGQLVNKQGGNQNGRELLVKQITLVGGCDGKVCQKARTYSYPDKLTLRIVLAISDTEEGAFYAFLAA